MSTASRSPSAARTAVLAPAAASTSSSTAPSRPPVSMPMPSCAQSIGGGGGMAVGGQNNLAPSGTGGAGGSGGNGGIVEVALQRGAQRDHERRWCLRHPGSEHRRRRWRRRRSVLGPGRYQLATTGTWSRPMPETAAPCRSLPTPHPSRPLAPTPRRSSRRASAAAGADQLQDANRGRFLPERSGARDRRR